MANLYVKYRPIDFDDMIGNKLVIQTLQKALTKPDHSHVYLFTGPSGCGKTTSARIMAKMLGTDELDIQEINTANNRGIDTARDIMNSSRMMPMGGSTKAYIMDECSRWTPDLQNAMKKILEDTPEHCYFFLCTVDKNKLIKEILTRCTEVKFELLSAEDIIKLVKRVSKLEDFGLSKIVIEAIAEKSDGCPRTALVILERVGALESEEDQLAYLKKVYLSDDDPEIIELCRILIDEKSSWGDVAKVLKRLQVGGKLDDPEKVRYSVLGYMNAVLLNGKKLPRAIKAMEAFMEPTYNTGKFGITFACLMTVL